VRGTGSWGPAAAAQPLARVVSTSAAASRAGDVPRQARRKVGDFMNLGFGPGER
jgi:hypothetical protein